MNAVDDLLTELRMAGQSPARELLDRVRAIGPFVIPALIETATDERLHQAEQESPLV
jgi:hypothetical protein